MEMTEFVIMFIVSENSNGIYCAKPCLAAY